MAINTQKVVTGGLAAGVVLAGLDFLINGVVLAEQNRAAMDALNPALMENMEGTTGTIAVIAIDLVMGLVLVWTYAAMRPRFGAGPKTAVIAGVQVWLVAALIYTFFTIVGMFPSDSFVLGAVLGLVMMVVPAVIGGMLYKEE